jgi:TRAP-type C4-dicarboxylate transport system permease small subunit
MNTPATQSAKPPGAPGMDIVARIARFSLAVAALALLGIVLVQGWQVIARYMLNDSPSWTEPVTVTLLATILGFGSAACVHDRRHFSFSLLADSMQGARARLLQALAQLAIALIGGVMAWWGGLLALDGMDIPAAGAALPQGASYLPLCLGGLLMVLFAFDHLRRDLRGKAPG